MGTENGTATLSSEISLYHLESALVDLIEAREAAETNEDRAVCDEQLRLYVAAEVRKVDGILAFMRTCKAHCEAAKTEAARLGKLSATWWRRLERLEASTLAAMQSFGMDRLNGNLGSFTARKNPASVDIYNDSLIPSEFCTATITMSGSLWHEWMKTVANGTPEALSALSRSMLILAEVVLTPRKAEIAAELKRVGHVAGARLITDNKRLEVR